MAVYCPTCGKSVQDTSKFCPHCGVRVISVPLPTSVSPPHPAASKGESKLLDDSVAALTGSGWRLRDRTDSTARIFRHKPFNILGLLLFWLVYLIYWEATREKEHFIEIKENTIYLDGKAISVGKPICEAKNASAYFRFAVFILILAVGAALFAIYLIIEVLSGASFTFLQGGCAIAAIVVLIYVPLSIYYLGKSAKRKAENTRLSSNYTLIKSGF